MRSSSSDMCRKPRISRRSRATGAWVRITDRQCSCTSAWRALTMSSPAITADAISMSRSMSARVAWVMATSTISPISSTSFADLALLTLQRGAMWMRQRFHQPNRPVM